MIPRFSPFTTKTGVIYIKFIKQAYHLSLYTDTHFHLLSQYIFDVTVTHQNLGRKFNNDNYDRIKISIGTYHQCHLFRLGHFAIFHQST